MDINWADKYVMTTEAPKNPKKITGTRLGAILGVNPYSTPFKAWCEMTKVYEEPFQDTIYTIAGKVIEPKQAEYASKKYIMNTLVTPTDKFGSDYFNKTRGDFFHEDKVFGGMWDYLFVDDNDKPTTVLEMKTTKHSEDWEKEPPIYYQLQASLYAYLLGVDDVIMVATFLEDSDYENPQDFVCDSNNTIFYSFKISERFPDFDKQMKKLRTWYTTHVLGGESPAFDIKKDADLLKVLKSKTLAPDTDMSAVLEEADKLQAEIDEIQNSITKKLERLDEIKNIIKKYCTNSLGEGDTSATLSGNKYTWKLSVQSNKGIDKNALIKDGLFEKYNTKVTTIYKLTCKEN